MASEKTCTFLTSCNENLPESQTEHLTQEQTSNSEASEEQTFTADQAAAATLVQFRDQIPQEALQGSFDRNSEVRDIHGRHTHFAPDRQWQRRPMSFDTASKHQGFTHFADNSGHLQNTQLYSEQNIQSTIFGLSRALSSMQENQVDLHLKQQNIAGVLNNVVTLLEGMKQNSQDSRQINSSEQDRGASLEGTSHGSPKEVPPQNTGVYSCNETSSGSSGHGNDTSIYERSGAGGKSVAYGEVVEGCSLIGTGSHANSSKEGASTHREEDGITYRGSSSTYREDGAPTYRNGRRTFSEDNRLTYQNDGRSTYREDGTISYREEGRPTYRNDESHYHEYGRATYRQGDRSTYHENRPTYGEYDRSTRRDESRLTDIDESSLSYTRTHPQTQESLSAGSCHGGQHQDNTDQTPIRYNFQRSLESRRQQSPVGYGFKLPPFNGKEERRVWINRFEAIAERRQWDNDTKLDNLLPKLQGTAGDFVFTQLPRRTLSSYTELVKELNSRFRIVETKRNFAAKFSQRVQRQNETVEEYAAELKRLYAKAYHYRDAETRQEDLVRRFLDGLRDHDARFEIDYNKEPADIDEAVYHAVNFIQTRRRSSYSDVSEKKFKKYARRASEETPYETEEEYLPEENEEEDHAFRVPIKSEKSSTKKQIKQEKIAENVEGVAESPKDAIKILTETRELMQRLMTQVNNIANRNQNTQIPQQRTSQMPRRGIVCYGCNESGHVVRECPHKTNKASAHTVQEKNDNVVDNRKPQSSNLNRPLN